MLPRANLAAVGGADFKPRPPTPLPHHALPLLPQKAWRGRHLGLPLVMVALSAVLLIGNALRTRVDDAPPPRMPATAGFALPDGWRRLREFAPAGSMADAVMAVPPTAEATSEPREPDGVTTPPGSTILALQSPDEPAPVGEEQPVATAQPTPPDGDAASIDRAPAAEPPASADHLFWPEQALLAAARLPLASPAEPGATAATAAPSSTHVSAVAELPDPSLLIMPRLDPAQVTAAPAHGPATEPAYRDEGGPIGGNSPPLPRPKPAWMAGELVPSQRSANSQYEPRPTPSRPTPAVRASKSIARPRPVAADEPETPPAGTIGRQQMFREYQLNSP